MIPGFLDHPVFLLLQLCMQDYNDHYFNYETDRDFIFFTHFIRDLQSRRNLMFKEY